MPPLMRTSVLRFIDCVALYATFCNNPAQRARVWAADNAEGSSAAPQKFTAFLLHLYCIDAVNNEFSDT